MQRQKKDVGRGGGGASGTRAEEAAAAAKVAPLLQLSRAAEEALRRSRNDRAVELGERALRAADAACLPADSLIVAHLLSALVASMLSKVVPFSVAGDEHTAAPLHATWLSDARLSALSRRALDLLHARWRAGSLFTYTPEEAVFFASRSLRHMGAFLLVSAAKDAAVVWPASRTPAEEEARLRGVYAALRALLQLDARGELLANERSGILALQLSAMRLLQCTLAMLPQLQAACGLTRAQEAALQQLAPRLESCVVQFTPSFTEDVPSFYQAHADADVARHGLRRCALPACGATEAHPKLYKLCGRCRKSAYCCAAHSVEDWKRHKREDGCTAAAPRSTRLRGLPS